MNDDTLQLHLAKMEARHKIYKDSPSDLLKLIKTLITINIEIYNIVSDNSPTDKVTLLLEKIGAKLLGNDGDRFKLIGKLNTCLDSLTDEEISCLIAQLNGRLANREITRISLEKSLPKE